MKYRVYEMSCFTTSCMLGAGRENSLDKRFGALNRRHGRRFRAQGFTRELDCFFVLLNKSDARRAQPQMPFQFDLLEYR